MRKFQKLVLFGSILAIVYFIIYLNRGTRTRKQVRYHEYLVNTTVCMIPDVDAFDDSVDHIIGRGVFVKCDRFPTFTFEENGRIHINWKQVEGSQYKNTLSFCKFWPIIRPVNETTDHNSFAHLQASPPFTNSSIVTDHEYVHVKCFDKEKKFLFQSFHTLIIEKDEVETRCKDKKSKFVKTNPSANPLSVLILVVDSVSRLNSIRFMKRTRNYILNTMNAVDMKGFNKVGYGTFHNMIPLTTGKFYEELPYNFRSPNVFDNYTFIWDIYSDNGFRTYLAEDYPFGALFDYQKMGFHNTPTDYYNRPLFLSMYKQPNIVYNQEDCILNQQQTQWVLNPLYKFLNKFKDKSYFSFNIITRLTHDKLEKTASADDLYYNFLKKGHENNIFNNTVVILMADHGMRFGPIRESFIGLLEERLPMLYIAFPDWFTEKYPLHMFNMKTNSQRLTTPFDLHKTLVDLLTFDGNLTTYSETNRSLNLFSEIPFNRTCADAAIESHWCTCSKLEDVDIKSYAVQDAAAFFVDNINRQLRDVRNLCEVLEIDELTQSYKANNKNKDGLEHLVSYKIVLRTKPGGGLFEGTVTYNSAKKSYSMSSEISRINAYGGEKRCKVNYLQERLCYCKSNKNA